jgi:hypothetical protein
MFEEKTRKVRYSTFFFLLSHSLGFFLKSLLDLLLEVQVFNSKVNEAKNGRKYPSVSEGVSHTANRYQVAAYKAAGTLSCKKGSNN